MKREAAWVPSPMILASTPDRAVTVRERDPHLDVGNDAPWGRRGALVDEVKGDPIRDQIPLSHGHGSVKWRLLHDLVADEVSTESYNPRILAAVPPMI